MKKFVDQQKGKKISPESLKSFIDDLRDGVGADGETIEGIRDFNAGVKQEREEYKNSGRRKRGFRKPQTLENLIEKGKGMEKYKRYRKFLSDQLSPMLATTLLSLGMKSNKLFASDSMTMRGMQAASVGEFGQARQFLTCNIAGQRKNALDDEWLEGGGLGANLSRDFIHQAILGAISHMENMVNEMMRHRFNGEVVDFDPIEIFGPEPIGGGPQNSPAIREPF